METENLAEMVRDHTTEKADQQPEENLDIESNETPLDNAVAEEEESKAINIKTISLVEWFEQNHMRFQNVNNVKVTIKDVDPDKTLIMSVLDPGISESEDSKRKLHTFENADEIQVLDLPGISMDVYNNGFKIICNHENVFMKCYGVKTGLFVVFCNNINQQLIPHEITKLKKKGEELEVIYKSNSEITPKFVESVDKEELMILYKQITKYIDDINTKQDAINWLLSRQSGVRDVNHHLQIDKTIVKTLN